MSKRDEMLVIKKRCAVTAFDLNIHVTRDGRERGLWIGVVDIDGSRADMVRRWVKRPIDTFIEGLPKAKTKTEKDTLVFLLESAIAQHLKTEVNEMGLLEWDDLEKLYNAIGKELKKHKTKEKK